MFLTYGGRWEGSNSVLPVTRKPSCCSFVSWCRAATVFPRIFSCSYYLNYTATFISPYEPRLKFSVCRTGAVFFPSSSRTSRAITCDTPTSGQNKNLGKCGTTGQWFRTPLLLVVMDSAVAQSPSPPSLPSPSETVRPTVVFSSGAGFASEPRIYIGFPIPHLI